MLLETPTRENIPGVDTRLATLQSWLQDQPYTNALLVCNELTQRLKDLNHQILPAARQLELLLAFNAPYERIHDSLRLLDKSADPTQAPQLASLHELTSQLLLGYKYVINSCLGEKLRWGKSRLLAQAVNLAAHLLTLQILGDWQRYLPTDDQSWQETGILYRLSLQKKLAVTERAELPLAGHTQSARHSYALLTILRLADPYRMPSGLVWDAYQYLTQHIADLNFKPPRPDADLTAGEYSLCLDCNPTEALQRAREQAAEPSSPRLDISALMDQTREDIKRLEAGARPTMLGLSNRISTSEAQQLLKQVLTQWQQHPERKLSRQEQAVDIELSPGLQTAYRLHNQGIAFDPNDYLSSSDDHEIDLSSLMTEESGPNRLQDKTLRTASFNRSAGGLAIRLPQASPGLRVGELVTVTPDPGQAGNRLIGSVRWVSNQKAQGQLAGIQYIAKDVQPVAIRPSDGDSHSVFHPALYYRLNQDGQNYELLISMRGMYRYNRMLEVDIQGERFHRNCDHLIESNNLFERFSLSPID